MTTLELQLPIVLFYLKTEQFITVRELAEETGYSRSAIRTNLERGVEGIVTQTETRTTYMRDMPASPAGRRKVFTYGPSLGLLARMLRERFGIKYVCPESPKLPGHRDSLRHSPVTKENGDD